MSSHVKAMAGHAATLRAHLASRDRLLSQDQITGHDIPIVLILGAHPFLR
jgi:hypothetical protein